MTPFYKQVLECWGEFHDVPCTVEEICNEFIFNNKIICSNNKPLQVELLKLPNTRIFKDMNINNILGNEGDILLLEQFCTKYDTFLLSTTRRICPKYGEIQTGMYFFLYTPAPQYYGY